MNSIPHVPTAIVNQQFQAISREAGLAAAHVGIGVSALQHANSAEDGYYAHAFFALSIGFERSAKLALVIDHALNHGTYPPHKVVRGFGHRLGDLLEKADQIAAKHGVPDAGERLPKSEIHAAIVDVLTDFASNVTRYYNLDFLTRDPRTASEDAVSQWHKRVTEAVMTRHYTHAARRRHEHQAAFLDSMISGHTHVLHTSETGRTMRTVEAAVLHGAATEFVKPFTRMYVLQIARFLSYLMSTLSAASYSARLESVPHLADFFRIFENDDKYFRQRKVWSIYRI